ncbi:ABC transporter permease [Okibacterium fritillariae]|jgi:oligopeptide transport system permease protein|uniref:Oligopeptide transport system permease protein n=1 Tax=Okibacterium fritillariae TaxID=123320 RepID=A0A1T5J0Q6_9MICO|nr:MULTISPECIES: ABC transporter permease [Microbacteriaceae]ONI63982.1 ABC transporter permease [Leifsonia sp. ALI-44-B]SKC45055.1 oligopeptide transport system permease protein [Okibacterium fritillariae]
MARYILFRLLQAIPVLLGTTFLIYFMVFAMPGDPLLALFGDKTPNPALLEQLREQYHLNEPFFVQYLYYLGGIFRFDFGVSYSGQPVTEILAQTFPVTIRLAILALLFEMIAGILIGLVSGIRKGGIFDASALVVSLILISLPIFVTAFLGQYFLGIALGWFRPTVGAGAPIQDLILPALVLASISFAQIVRLTRSSVIETKNLDFVRTAYSKGLSSKRIVPVHILRNSLIPVVTYLGTDFGVLLVGATVTEGIFNVPGVGRTLYQAILKGEGPTVVSFVTVMVLIYLVVNLLVDLLYAVLDPRIRYAK